MTRSFRPSPFPTIVCRRCHRILLHEMGQSTVYIRAVSTNLYLTFGTFDSFLAGRGRNQTHSACCTDHLAHGPFKPVWQSRQQGLKPWCPNIYTVGQSIVIDTFSCSSAMQLSAGTKTSNKTCAHTSPARPTHFFLISLSYWSKSGTNVPKNYIFVHQSVQKSLKNIRYKNILYLRILRIRVSKNEKKQNKTLFLLF